jgi:hypothetical protein
LEPEGILQANPVRSEFRDDRREARLAESELRWLHVLVDGLEGVVGVPREFSGFLSVERHQDPRKQRRETFALARVGEQGVAVNDSATVGVVVAVGQDDGNGGLSSRRKQSADAEEMKAWPGATQMQKVGRNEACPCGSGRKFKRCCLERVEKEERLERFTVERDRVLAEREREEKLREGSEAKLAEATEFEQVARRAEAVLWLIKNGRIDEAEATARQLAADFPHDTVAMERLGQVYEAKGQKQAAADEYRRGVARMDAQGDGHFCDCCRARLVKAMRRLDPDHPAPALGRDPQ